MKTYKNVLFDVDNTLLDFNKAEAAAIESMFKDFHIPFSEDVLNKYREINGGLWRRHESEGLPIDVVLNSRFKLLFEAYDKDVDGPAMEKSFRKYLEEGHELIDGAFEVLNELKDKMNLYVMTNGVSTTQHKRLKLAQIDRFFKAYFISGEIGFQKPSIEFFERSFAEIPDFSHNETIIIGDSLGADILGGINSSIDTIWFNPNRNENKSDIIPTYEIHHIKEILNYIK